MAIAMGRNLDWSKPRRVFSAWYEHPYAFGDRPCEHTPPKKPKKAKKGRRRKRAKVKLPATPLIRWVAAEPSIIRRRSDPSDDDQPPW